MGLQEGWCERRRGGDRRESVWGVGRVARVQEEELTVEGGLMTKRKYIWD